MSFVIRLISNILKILLYVLFQYSITELISLYKGEIIFGINKDNPRIIQVKFINKYKIYIYLNKIY